MKLHIFSDLHMELYGPWYPREGIDADMYVIAGDINNGLDSIYYLNDLEKPSIFVLGNHDYYWKQLNFIGALKKKAKNHVHILDNDSVKIGGVTFLGCTLWTDFNLYPDLPDCEEKILRSFPDYRYIKEGSRTLTTGETKAKHAESVAWLHRELKDIEGKVVVVSHHLPSERSTPAKYRGDVVSPAFASNLDPLLEQYNIDLWVHGHTHTRMDYIVKSSSPQIKDTRVICNPRGYRGEWWDFLPDLVIEV